MRRPLIVLVAVLSLAVLASCASAPTGRSGGTSCATSDQPQLTGARVLSVTAAAHPGGTYAFPANPPNPTPSPIAGVPAYCDVTVLLAHPELDDRVRVEVWMPLTGWNGRFLAAGGGGFVAGLFDRYLAPAVKDGYAAASTDAGVSTNGSRPPSWALDHSGNVNQGLLTNFAFRSVHEMAQVGKQLTASFYGRPAAHSYWNGCSTGGRQGLMEAQRYPADFNGILAAAPAINWDRFTVAEFWPQAVMNQAHTFPTACEFNAFTQAAIAACDRDDSVADRVIDRPENCRFNPHQLVGTTVTCEGKTVQISQADAELVDKIWQGPTSHEGQHLWYGPLKGTPLDGLAATAAGPDGTRHGAPFAVAADWIKYFLKRRPGFDTSSIGYGEFEQLFQQSGTQYHAVIGTDNPDLSAFRDAGGKMITWHGLADRLISPQGTIDYRRRVEAAMGGTGATDQFYRVFLAPGVDHCSGGTGSVPTDPLAAVVDWVEHGHAPETLPAATTSTAGRPVTRNLCSYPQLSHYIGHGDPDSAGSYTCA
ncbi:MAG: tannase/feruloyl esterase family alpha/beta hydrolase [Pseudonocardiales bacterium]|nr:tannase/feruloyl esterase family alpha/beta hydrolase [Pseudonocardiales bacterium]